MAWVDRKWSRSAAIIASSSFDALSARALSADQPLERVDIARKEAKGWPDQIEARSRQGAEFLRWLIRHGAARSA